MPMRPPEVGPRLRHEDNQPPQEGIDMAGEELIEKTRRAFEAWLSGDGGVLATLDTALMERVFGVPVA